MTRRHLPIIVCAQMALLAALIPHLVDPARSGLLILAVAIAIAASLGALCLLGTSRRPAALTPPASRASMRLPDALPETAPGEEENVLVGAPTLEELADLRARAVPSRGGALYAWRSGDHAIPPGHESWFESVVHAYQLYVIQDCARKHWGESVAAALQDAFTRELEDADPARADSYSLLHDLLSAANVRPCAEEDTMLASIEHGLAMDLLEDDPHSTLAHDVTPGSSQHPGVREFNGLDVSLGRALAHGRRVAISEFHGVLAPHPPDVMES